MVRIPGSDYSANLFTSHTGRTWRSVPLSDESSVSVYVGPTLRSFIRVSSLSALMQTSQLSYGSMEGTFPAQQGWWELISLKVYLFSINPLPLFPLPLGPLNPSWAPTSIIAMLHP